MTTPSIAGYDAPFTGRDIDVKVIESIEGKTLRFGDGWCFGGVPADVLPRLIVGAEYLQETRNFSMVTGMATCYRTRSGEPVVGEWLWHKTDADLDREHAEWLAKWEAEKAQRLAESQADYLRREGLLPLSLRRRLDRFHANGGQEFKRDGWGYELIVCELAVLYAASEQADTEAIDEYAREHGTSGNQHDYAKALSRLLTDDPEDEDAVANSVSALSPLTGNADYTRVLSPAEVQRTCPNPDCPGDARTGLGHLKGCPLSPALPEEDR